MMAGQTLAGFYLAAYYLELALQAVADPGRPPYGVLVAAGSTLAITPGTSVSLSGSLNVELT